MSELTIDFEWIDPLAARGAELRATWARLFMAVDNYPLTRVFDQRSKTMRDAVYLPLYPFAEWLVERWWSLWTEPGLSSSSDRPGYDTRHSLAHAREGYALPPVRIEPAGSIVLVSWYPEKLPSQRLEFPGQGMAWIETNTLKDRLSFLIEAIVTRLENNEITDSRLQEEWAAIRAADADERAFCECAGALGLDPYDLDDTQREEIEKVGNLLPEEIVAEFFRSARSEMGDFNADAEEVRVAVENAERNMMELRPLTSLARLVGTWGSSSGGAHWEQGYSFAQRLRAHFGLNGKPLKTMEDIENVLGIGKNDLDNALGKFSNRSIPFAALVGINHKHSPAFILRPALPASARFHFCRALFEYLYAPMKRSSLITDANTDQQKRNRAFAAELLAPAAALRDRIRSPVVTWEKAEELAEEFGVSAYVIGHQLENHRIAGIQQE